MATENVGGISYTVSLDTREMIEGQRRVDRTLRQSAQSVENFGGATASAASAVKPMAMAVAALGVSLAAAGVASAKAADEVRLLGSRVEIAAGSVEAGAQAMAAIIDIARETRNGVAETAQVFNRLNQSILQMGGTQQDTLKLTDLLGKSIKVSGVSAQEASAAMLQFGQALGSGKLQGDELRSLMENAPYLMKQLADGIGVPVGALKTLGEQGALTADVVVNALGKASSQINADFEKMSITVDEAMTLAADAAARLNAQMDEQTGTSAALAGAIKGVADAFDGLLVPMDATDKQSQRIQRENAIAEWAAASTETMAVLADAADVVWQTLSVLGRNVAFVFKGIGSEIGGIGAQIAAVARGDFAAAVAIGDEMKKDAAARRAALDKADAETLRARESWGDRIRRQAGKNSAAVYGEFSQIGGSAAPAAKGNGKGGKSDAQREAERKAKEAARNEEEFQRRVMEIKDKARRDEIAAEQEQARIEADAIKRGQEMVQQLEESRMSPADQAALDWQRKLEVINAAQALDLDNQQIYLDAKINAEAEYQDKLRKIQQENADAQMQSQSAMLVAASSGFDALAGLAETFQGKQSSAYKAMFAASKAFALANAGLNLYSAVSQALADPTALTPAQKFANYAAVAAAAGGVVSAISGMNFGGGRQYGGAVSSGSLYRVNETGAPEMFTAANGKQFMLPTANGSVTPANQLGGGGGVQIVVNNNMAGADVQATASPDGRMVEIAVNRAVSEVASQFRNNSGQVWQAAKSATNIQGRTA